MVTKPNANFNACDDFFEVIITAHVLAAAYEVLEMTTLSDTPNVHTIPNPDTVWMLTDTERESILKETCMLIVDRFINMRFHETSDLSTSDKVYDYSRHLLSIGCLYHEMRDAVKEGDGDRVLQCWRY